MTDKERVIAEAVEAAREYLYRGGIHHMGNFHAMLGNGGAIDLAEVLAFYAINRYAAALERAAQVADELRAPNDNLGDYNLACSRVAAAIRALKEKAAG